MIVRDEEENLKACLASAADVCTDVVVVDTGSKDATREEARRAGARVFEFPWCDDFSRARNESIRHAQGKWIFWLDADERLDEPNRAELRRLLASMGDEPAAYLMTQSSPGADGAPTRELLQARLFPNDPRIRWELRVHEQIGRAIQRAGLPLRRTKVRIQHLGYIADALVKQKLERNLRLVDLDCAENPSDGLPRYQRATILLDLRRGAEALEAFRQCEPSMRGTTTERSIPLLKVRAHVVAGNLAGALAEARAGLARYPDDTTLRYNEAGLLAALGDYKEAERSLRAQMGRAEEHAFLAPVDRTIAALHAPLLLADVLLMQERFAEADDEARRLLEQHAQFGQAWLTRGEALLAQGKKKPFEKMCARLASTKASAGVAALRAIERSRGGDHAGALDLLDRELQGQPRHPILLRTKAQVLLARGERGAVLDETVRAALELAPLCVRTRAVERARSK
jgi:tetratricopeptide (TPR) repeat protein